MHELHHDERHSADWCPSGAVSESLAGVVDTHDRRMGHARRGCASRRKRVRKTLSLAELAIQDLDGDSPAQSQVIAPEDAGHAAAPDGLVDAVAPRKHARLMLSRSLPAWEHKPRLSERGERASPAARTVAQGSASAWRRVPGRDRRLAGVARRTTPAVPPLQVTLYLTMRVVPSPPAVTAWSAIGRRSSGRRASSRS